MPVAGQALIGLGDLARERNNLPAARRYVEDGVSLIGRWSEVSALEGHAALSRVSMAEGDLDGAWDHIARAREMAWAFDISDLDDRAVALIEAKMRLAQGDLGWVREWSDGGMLYDFVATALQEGSAASYEQGMRKYELAVLAQLLIVDGQAEEALTLLRSLAPIARWRDRPALLVEYHVLMAIAHRARGQHAKAAEVLVSAIAIGERGGFVRSLLDAGEDLTAILQDVVESGGPAAAYARRLLGELAREPGLAPEAARATVQRGADAPAAKLLPGQPEVARSREIAGRLSEREIDVLRFLDTHLTSPEIGAELFISANTVRFHIKNIYSKLGVHRRSDAVETARQLGLV